MGLPEAPRPVSVGNCLAVFLLGFEAAIWHFRGTTTCFYWASKLPSGTFPAALKTLKTLPAALPWDFPRPHDLFLLETAIWQCFCWASQLLSGISQALQPVSIGLRSCHLAFPSSLSTPYFPAPLQSLKTLPAALPWVSRPRELFLLAFAQTVAAWPWCLPLCFSIAPSKLQNPPTPA